MIRRHLATLLLAVLVPAHAHAAASAKAPAAPPASPAADLVGAKRALHAAVTSGTTKDILAARARFAALSAASPKSAALHYWVALADWRVTPRFDDKAMVERYCTDGLAEAETALKLDPKNAEAAALKSSLLGMSLNFRPSAMFTIGPEIESTLKSALVAAPDNPRVLLLAAINTLNKPAFVGGGADQALPQFVEAQKRFDATAAAPADSTAPDWGRDDAYLWAGRAAMKLEDYAAARGYFEKALEVSPDHAWVRHQLLPEAEKALAAAAAPSK